MKLLLQVRMGKGRRYGGRIAAFTRAPRGGPWAKLKLAGSSVRNAVRGTDRRRAGPIRKAPTLDVGWPADSSSEMTSIIVRTPGFRRFCWFR